MATKTAIANGQQEDFGGVHTFGFYPLCTYEGVYPCFGSFIIMSMSPYPDVGSVAFVANYLRSQGLVVPPHNPDLPASVPR